MLHNDASFLDLLPPGTPESWYSHVKSERQNFPQGMEHEAGDRDLIATVQGRRDDLILTLGSAGSP